MAKAASRDETRPVLTGILVSLEDGTLRMVATDSYRLSVKEAAVPGMNGSAFEANVPARALQELGRVVAETQPESVSIVTQDNQVVFESGRVTLSSRLIDGQFPNYRQLLPGVVRARRGDRQVGAARRGAPREPDGPAQCAAAAALRAGHGDAVGADARTWGRPRSPCP